MRCAHRLLYYFTIILQIEWGHNSNMKAVRDRSVVLWPVRDRKAAIIITHIGLVTYFHIMHMVAAVCFKQRITVALMCVPTILVCSFKAFPEHMGFTIESSCSFYPDCKLFNAENRTGAIL